MTECLFIFYSLWKSLLTVRQDPINVCSPSPCGPYSICREVNGHAVCSCQADYIGSPPNCRPECLVSSECSQDKACVNQRCVDPCIGTCGQNAKCQVINHNPICSCSNGYTGDPFVRCTRLERKSRYFSLGFLGTISQSYTKILRLRVNVTRDFRNWAFHKNWLSLCHIF